MIVVTEDTESWEVEYVAVNPNLQGAGIGRQLMQHVEFEALSRRITRLTLHTAVAMTELVGFYKRLGFKVSHEGLPIHGRDSNPRVYMCKNLAPPL